MGETGVLPPDARVELLDGEIKDMSPIGPFHGGVINRLNEIFTDAKRGRWQITIQNPVRLDPFSEPQPDLALAKPSTHSYTRHHPRSADICLVVEVADSSLAADREIKLPLYGRAGIPEVWIVNLIDLALEVYREPGFNGYASKSILRPGDVANPLAFPDVAVDIAKLLER